MTETIIVALITLTSGIIGAVSGALVSLKLDKRTSARSIREERKVCYAQMIAIYSALMGEIAKAPNLTDGLPPEKEQELYTQFQAVQSTAILICGEDSIAPIAEFFNQITSLHLRETLPNELHPAYHTALTAMRREIIDQRPSMLNRLKTYLERHTRRQKLAQAQTAKAITSSKSKQ